MTPVITMADVDVMPTGHVIGRLLLSDGCPTIDDAVALFPAGPEWDDGADAAYACAQELEAAEVAVISTAL